MCNLSIGETIQVLAHICEYFRINGESMTKFWLFENA